LPADCAAINENVFEDDNDDQRFVEAAGGAVRGILERKTGTALRVTEVA